VEQEKDWNISACCIQHISPRLDPPTPDSSPEPSVSPTGKAGKPLNVAAIAIGVTGAVLLLVVCGAIILYMRRRKRKEKLPPSAEFADVAFMWHPRAYHETTSPTASMFTPKDARSFASSPIEPLRYNAPCPPAPTYLP